MTDTMTAQIITTITLGIICDDCAILIASGDDSGLDPHTATTCQESIETISQLPDGTYGHLAITISDDSEHLLTCTICQTTTLGYGHTAELLI